MSHHTRALNDEEVLNEMKKMVAFINQEAIEKAREIKVKADEEFNIEKAKLVRQESNNIEATYQRKIKQAEIQKKITQSNVINKSRLKLLQARQQYLEEVFNETVSQLIKVPQDNVKYRDILKNLILQGLYQLMDEQVKVIVKKSDVDLANNAIQAASQNYKETTKRDIIVEIDKENNLPDDSAGGVILTSHFGRIRINNTLEERLVLAQEELLPEIRVLLFGHSPNRKHFH
ncbi:ATPase, V1/A1 complex, subunit E [Glomus cerebriforme]|uniref:ATPase, V1/A1 complex, subunit E n=1 Tax=Glomus cerebriforme TaxID=658196 RepID=A0A397T041_9GLOM|nr:ATPase, V1/A1 complex, subunit E [Glomus cerebriforme]